MRVLMRAWNLKFDIKSATNLYRSFNKLRFCIDYMYIIQNTWVSPWMKCRSVILYRGLNYNLSLLCSPYWSLHAIFEFFIIKPIHNTLYFLYFIKKRTSLSIINLWKQWTLSFDSLLKPMKYPSRKRYLIAVHVGTVCPYKKGNFPNSHSFPVSNVLDHDSGFTGVIKYWIYLSEWDSLALTNSLTRTRDTL